MTFLLKNNDEGKRRASNIPLHHKKRNCYFLAQSKGALYELHISSIDESGLAQITFAFACFRREDMTHKCMITANFSATGYGKTFFRAGFCLHFWHNTPNINKIILQDYISNINKEKE